MVTAENWTGGQATALCKAMRLTVDRFAARLGVAPRTVANWKRNPEMVPRIEVQSALDELLHSADTGARARFTEVVERPVPLRSDELRNLRDTISNLSARLALVERLIAGPPDNLSELQGTSYGGRR